jgi:GNAT superfamily N-acetyltransferase
MRSNCSERNRKPTSSQFKAPGAPAYSTKQLSERTWSDFECLFETHPAPGAYPCWCTYNHRPGPAAEKKGQSRAAQIDNNRQGKKALVQQGRSHGILVYAEGEPVGWCQFGLSQDLPRMDSNPRYRKVLAGTDRARWRITCFVVQKKFRRRGVTRTALKAALSAIQNEGGGLVEAYPVTRWGAYQKYRGTVSMFESEGFQIVAPLGKSNVLMQRLV